MDTKSDPIFMEEQQAWLWLSDAVTSQDDARWLLLGRLCLAQAFMVTDVTPRPTQRAALHGPSGQPTAVSCSQVAFSATFALSQPTSPAANHPASHQQHPQRSPRALTQHPSAQPSSHFTFCLLATHVHSAGA
jgi:hypothetical protein